jgi:hypothetical protein
VAERHAAPRLRATRADRVVDATRGTPAVRRLEPRRPVRHLARVSNASSPPRRVGLPSTTASEPRTPGPARLRSDPDITYRPAHCHTCPGCGFDVCHPGSEHGPDRTLEPSAVSAAEAALPSQRWSAWPADTAAGQVPARTENLVGAHDLARRCLRDAMPNGESDLAHQTGRRLPLPSALVEVRPGTSPRAPRPPQDSWFDAGEPGTRARKAARGSSRTACIHRAPCRASPTGCGSRRLTSRCPLSLPSRADPFRS